MKLSEWQAKLRNATAPLVTEPAAPAPRPWALPSVVGVNSDDLGGRFEIVLPLDKAMGDLDVREQVLKRLARAGYAGLELKVQKDRDIMSDTMSYSYHIEGDEEHPATQLVARIEARSAEVDGPCVRLNGPPRRASKMHELLRCPRPSDHELIARFLADMRQFGAWPEGCYIKNMVGSSAAPQFELKGEVTTADGMATERFRIDLRGDNIGVQCKAWPKATAVLSIYAMEEFGGR